MAEGEAESKRGGIDTHNVIRYDEAFADRETENIWNGLRSRKLPPDIQDKALVKLALLNRATVIDDLRIPPGNRLEKLKGERLGQYSIRITAQWRIVFDWLEGTASNVQIVDYH